MLALNARVLSDLSLLESLDEKQLSAICCTCAEMLLGTQHPQLRRNLSKSAVTYGWSTQQLERALLGLSKLLVECSKANVSENELKAAIHSVNIDTDQLRAITDCYLQHKNEISRVSKFKSSSNLPEYRNLQWRLDIRMESRYCWDQCDPTLIFRLETDKPPSSMHQETVFQMDYANLKRMEAKLTEALDALNSAESDRIQRYLT